MELVQAKEARMSAVRAMDRMLKHSQLTHMDSHVIRAAWKPQIPKNRH